jgi:hypothetical protein
MSINFFVAINIHLFILFIIYILDKSIKICSDQKRANNLLRKSPQPVLPSVFVNPLEFEHIYIFAFMNLMSFISHERLASQ